MGRYYNGDIEGKFWFAVQPSDCADRFGAIGYTPEAIQYDFSKEEHYDKVCVEIKAIEKALGDNKEKLDKFFEDNNGYNDEMLVKAGFPKDKIKHMLEDYADLRIGKQIKECLEKQGYCCFEGEC